jgi:3-oxoacyl-[acyl-carrier protein] reductase
MKIDFTGKTVLITGASRGIGRQIAEDMGRCGARLILTCSNEKGLEEFRMASSQNRAAKMCHAVDFRNRQALKKWIAELCSQEKIDVCINNAGTNKIRPIDDVTDDDWDDLTKINLEAPLLITREVSKGMKERRFGRIINIASIFGVISKPKRALYSITKFGLRGLTVASALDLAPYNVLVNSVSPGFVMTELTAKILKPNEMDEIASQVPLGRFAQPEEISKTVLFLASELNTYMTAQNVVIDGGFTNV